MQRADLSETNRVMVRYWPGPLSSLNLHLTGSLISFGHVALQTFVGGPDNRGHYISFWRADTDRRCCGIQEDHVHTREEDVTHCGPAHIDNTFTLYTLNPRTINAAYESMLQRGIRWELRAILIHSPDENAAVCSSLIHRLLVKGGIERLVSPRERLFLGFLNTTKLAALTGLSSSLYFVPKLIDLIQNLKYINITFSCAKQLCKTEQWGHYAYLPDLRDCEKFIHDTPAHGHSYWVYHHESPFAFFKFINTLRESYGWMASSSALTIIILTVCIGTFLGQRTATNYLFVKPGDFPLIMQHALKTERSLRAGIGLFDRGISARSATVNPALGPHQHRPGG